MWHWQMEIQSVNITTKITVPNLDLMFSVTHHQHPPYCKIVEDVIYSQVINILNSNSFSTLSAWRSQVRFLWSTISYLSSRQPYKYWRKRADWRPVFDYAKTCVRVAHKKRINTLRRVNLDPNRLFYLHNFFGRVSALFVANVDKRR